ncbi:hypothetical protein DMB44_00685 [Thermoplasma sp. Kam2015]|uniref:glucodextranase DOMON-like domain-containing protein n=1 Tax=Thermoplasma sp. Kam2015 TaxID=2094122 RepID=UPI000D8E5E0F|nr:glucodextranase DOMON-like domain-containing protein [Thermoplasma sp. Kam2015]PYB69105.1 hypothetical protein DMB44_00685 [Thermoplasma sp. Kam2015]
MRSSNNIIIVLSLTVLFLMSVISIPISAASPMANSAIHVNEGNITFTGNTQADFAGHIVYRNYMASPWGKNNNISSFYVSFNATYLFLGVSENISDNALYIFMSNNTGSDYGTYEISNLNVWARDIKFTEPLNYFSSVWFGGENTGITGYGTFLINTSITSNTPNARMIPSIFKFDSSTNSTEIAIPWTSMFPSGYSGTLVMNLSLFVVGGSGSWVGTGIPYYQEGSYNDGTYQSLFTVNNTLALNFGYVNIPSSRPKPINLAIIYNDHQPLYKIVGSNNYILPWTEAHATAEYIEQALIAHMFPQINVTYEMSGSLLYQLVNISTDPYYNNTFIRYAFIPYSTLNTTENQSLLANITADYFSIPEYVFELNEPASNEYRNLHDIWMSGGKLSSSQFEDLKVLWFLYDISTPLIEGQLGSNWINSTIWAMHNQTSFNQKDLLEILHYSKWLTGQVIPAFRNDMQGNQNGSNNVELFTSPFYHPLTPLLLANNISGPEGSIEKASYYSDVLAQMNISRGQFHSLFGQWPSGMYAPEFTVSYRMMQAIDESGAIWSNTAEATLMASGIDASGYDFGNGGNISQMLNLYTPYVAIGPDNTSVYMFFRDGYISNNWAFNYGNLPTWVAVDNIINYLKGVYSAIPAQDHARTLVTIGIDGENWMFMSPFAEDGVPFLEDLYKALDQNSSYIHTVTPDQFIQQARSDGLSFPVLTHIATAGWNSGNGKAAPYQNNIYLTQWSGDSVQDFYWEALNSVRNKVVEYQKSHNLTQIENYSAFESNLTARGPEGNLTRAWNAVYAAEGSDWFFQMAPWTISSSNTLPFDYIFKGDLIYALKQIGSRVPNYLTLGYSKPLTPYSLGDYTQQHTPSLNGYAGETISTPYGIASSPVIEDQWNDSIRYVNSNSTYGSISQVDIEYNSTTIFVQIYVNGDAWLYGIDPLDEIGVYMSLPDPSMGSNISNDVQSASFYTVGGMQKLDFAATYAAVINTSSFDDGAGYYNAYTSTGLDHWSSYPHSGSMVAFARSVIQFAIPMSFPGYVPGNSFEMGVFAHNGMSQKTYFMSPFFIHIPISIASYVLISSIHNTVPPVGDGNYTYPDQPTQIPPGSLDLEYINVSENQFDVQWAFKYAQLWNIWNGPLGFSNQIINIFISNGSRNGRTYLGNGPNADSTVPWQTLIYISGWATYIQTLSGTTSSGIIVTSNLSRGDIYVTIPIGDIGRDLMSYRYIIVAGSYDGYGLDGWRIVDQSNTTNGGWQGGGGDPPWSSNIYTYIAPATVHEGKLTQQEALANFSINHPAQLMPIELPGINETVRSSLEKINSTVYDFPTVVRSGNAYYMYFISNRSGINMVYASSTHNFISWSTPVRIPGTAWASDLSVSASNGLVYLAYVKNSSIILDEGWGTFFWTIGAFHSNAVHISLYSTTHGLFLLETFRSGDRYTYSLIHIVNGNIVKERHFDFAGQSYGSISGFWNKLVISYYDHNDGNYTIHLILFTENLNGISSYTYNTDATLKGIVSIAIARGNIIYLSYVSFERGIYTLEISTFLLNRNLIPISTFNITSSTFDISNPSITIGWMGNIILAWHQIYELNNTVFALRLLPIIPVFLETQFPFSSHVLKFEALEMSLHAFFKINYSNLIILKN